MVVLLEIWIECDAEKSIFLLSEYFDFSKGDSLSSCRMNTANLALKRKESTADKNEVVSRKINRRGMIKRYFKVLEK